jgi:hypothetical protein
MSDVCAEPAPKPKKKGKREMEEMRQESARLVREQPELK